MKKLALKLSVFSSLFLICSCASLEAMHRDWQAQNCNKDNGYSTGMNDARNGANMNSQGLAGQCPPETQNEVRAGYNAGFTAGLESMKSDQPVLNVNIGGEGGSPMAPDAGWFCELSVFGRNYHAFGPTRLMAWQKVKDRCSAENNEVHCGGAQCRINR